MPRNIRSEFRTEGCTARITIRKSGKNGVCYEIRYRRNGYNVTASSTNLKTAKEKFIKALHSADKIQTKKSKPTVPTTFTAFAQYYFENFRLERVKDNTYKNDVQRLNKWLIPHFGEKELAHIMPLDCKALIQKATAQGKSKTAEELYSLMSIIFKGAIAHALLERSPLAIVQTVRHERTHGTPLTAQDEKRLLSHYKGLERVTLAIMLYCGLRPNEVSTATLDGQFIVAVNSKQKNGKTAYKRIPITPMLTPYMSEFVGVKDASPKVLNKYIKAVLPDHTAKDCRMTFATRCQECGVNTDLVKIWMGHSLGSVLGNSYTKFSLEYQIKEAQKVKY